MFASNPMAQVSLEDLANDFCEQHGISISKQAIQERFNNNAVAFMQALLKEQLSRQLSMGKDRLLCSLFKRVRIKDSTRFVLPQAYAAVYKGHGGTSSLSQISLQYEYDLINGKMLCLDLTSGCRNDQQDSKETLDDIQKGDLLIRDLAYTSKAFIAQVTNKEAYYLNRLNPKWKICDSKFQTIDFGKVLRKLKTYSLPFLELDIFINIGNELYPSRLVVSRVDERTYLKRINKAQKEGKRKGYELSNSFKTSALLNLFITNIPKHCLSTEQVRVTYSLRWQIELIFKIWKSQGNINKIKVVKIQRFQCELIARLLWILLNWQMYRLIQKVIKTKCSPWKFFKAAYRMSHILKQAFFDRKSVKDWICKITLGSIKKYYTEPKRGKPDLSPILNAILA